MAPVVRSLVVLLLVAVNLRTLLGAFGAGGASLADQLGGGGIATGMASGVSVALIALGAPLSKVLVRRFSIDTAVVLSLATTAAGLAFLSLNLAAATWMAALLGGLASGVVGALLPAIARSWMPNALGVAVGLMMAVTSGGLAVASILVASSIEHSGSWSRATTALAALALCASAAYWVESRRRSTSATSEGETARPSSAPTRLPRWAVALTAFLAVQSFVLFAQIAWLAPTLEATGASTTVAGSMLGLFSGLQVVAAIASTSFAQRFDGFGVLVVVASALSLLGTVALLAALLGGAPAPVWAVIAASLGHGASFAVANLAIAKSSSDAETAARIGAAVMFASQGVGSLGPVVTGGLGDTALGLGGAWALLAVLGVAQVALAVSFARSSSADRAHHPVHPAQR